MLLGGQVVLCAESKAPNKETIRHPISRVQVRIDKRSQGDVGTANSYPKIESHSSRQARLPRQLSTHSTTNTYIMADENKDEEVGAPRPSHLPTGPTFPRARPSTPRVACVRGAQR